jgi:hypothetical protein
MPAVIRITWPPQPTVSDTRRFPEVAAALARLFATAATELARIKQGEDRRMDANSHYRDWA